MIVIKRRLIFWLFKAYLKKWGKIIVVCFLLGLVGFFLLKSSLPYVIAAITGVSKESVGIVGAYTLDTLPKDVVSDISEGLTTIAPDGSVKPDVAQSWTISKDGKKYIFYLNKNVLFSDGTPVTSKKITYSFSDVSVDRPNDYTIVFTLKEPYSPFLTSVSRPIFKEGYVGIGEYRIKQASFNGTFLQSLTLASSTKTPALKIYQFYPTQDSLKVAFALGEITKALHVTDTSFQNTSFDKFPHVTISKGINYSQLVAIFYNTQDKNLSDKKLRDALSYALPNTFSSGERAYSPIAPPSWAYSQDISRTQDLTHAQLLLEASIGKDIKNFPPITITTLPRFVPVAQVVQNSWKKIGISSTIQVVDSLPPVFQVYIGEYMVPQDPDQYTLWHSLAENNITNYKSVRIDKLLEDGRKTLDKSQRASMYAEFQKYLVDDQPATFLYFPYSYTLTKN